ncbi:uncharacterized protein LOC134710549 [Mytilus trossulus]|uniref:uncharacterized protein LOC134710549 n=1 Tax=Mytilus trossulus TaxID=6551 RepID=UPI003003F35F
MDDKRKIQKIKVIEEINTIRKSLDDYLNRLEQQIRADLESKYSKLESKLNTLVKQIEHRSVKIHELQDDFSKMTRYATELQMYVGLRKMEKTTSEATKYIEGLNNSDDLKEINLDIKMSSALQSILQDVKSFGDINITASRSTVKIKAGREDQAQLVNTFPGIEQIKPFLLKPVTMPEKIGRVDIFACSLLPDRKILILDNRGQRILLFSNDGIFMRTVLTFKDPPYDLCSIRNNIVAISFGTLKLLTLIDIDKNKIIKRIKLSRSSYGVASDSHILVITSGTLDKKCTILNLKDMSKEILEGVEGHYISLFNGNIYCTQAKEHKVSCYTRTGEHLWSFLHNDIKNPYGLALDINGFIYVASNETNKIVVVSPDGKTSKTILSESDGMFTPFGIDIHRDTGLMVVPFTTNNGSPNICVFILANT